MKKIKIIALCVVAVIVAGLLTGCVSVKKFEPNQPNLAKGATFKYADGSEEKKFSLKGSGENSVTINFGKKVALNTVMLREAGSNISEFEIWADGEFLYKQDEIGDIRTCYLGDRTASELTIKVTAAAKSYNLSWCGVYDMPRENKDFRVTTYLEVGENAERLEWFDSESLKHADEVILFNSTDFCFVEDSTVAVNRQTLQKSLDFVRASNLNINITLCLLPKAIRQETMDLDWPHNIAKIHSNAFTERPENLSAEIKTLLDEYSLEGVGFDYEYPQTNKDWKIYSDYVVSLKEVLGDKKLSLAIQYIGGNFTAAARRAVDTFEIMCYDFIGKNAAHATFYDGITNTLNLLQAKKFDLKKLNIGVPFYSRPQQDLGNWTLPSYWGDYKEYAESMGKFTNSLTVNKTVQGAWEQEIYVEKLYFNSYQMIMDKTAFLYDYGVGGLMIWNYGSDLPYANPLSLHRAVNETLQR